MRESTLLREELKKAYEEEIARRDRMWREACDVLEKRLRDEYTHTDKRLAESRDVEVKRKASTPPIVQSVPIQAPQPTPGLAVDDLDKVSIENGR